MADKYKTIASLEQELKEIETEYCFAAREGNTEATQELYQARGAVIWDLQNVK